MMAAIAADLESSGVPIMGAPQSAPVVAGADTP